MKGIVSSKFGRVDAAADQPHFFPITPLPLPPLTPPPIPLGEYSQSCLIQLETALSCTYDQS